MSDAVSEQPVRRVASGKSKETRQRVLLGSVLAEVKAGFASGRRAHDGVIQLRMNNVDTSGRILWDRFLRVPAEPAVIDEYRLQCGDVVFNNTNSTELVGKSALFAGHVEPVVYSNHFTRLRVKPDRCVSSYLSYWLNHEWQSGTFAKICNQWIGQSAVKPDKLLALHIPLPSIGEQTRITEWLTRGMEEVSTARQNAHDRLAAAEALPAAILRDVFESKRARGWDTVELCSLVRTPIRTGISRPGRSDSAKRCLTLSAVRGRLLQLDACKPADVSDTEAEECWVRPGCFYIVRGNGNRELVGRGAFAPESIPEPRLFPDLLFQLDLGERVDPAFFWCLWSSEGVRREIEDRARTAAGIYKINTANLKSLPLAIPSRVEQQRLAADLSRRLVATDDLIARSREELAAIDALPAALLRDAFADKETVYA